VWKCWVFSAWQCKQVCMVLFKLKIVPGVHTPTFSLVWNARSLSKFRGSWKGISRDQSNWEIACIKKLSWIFFYQLCQLFLISFCNAEWWRNCLVVKDVLFDCISLMKLTEKVISILDFFQVLSFTEQQKTKKLKLLEDINSHRKSCSYLTLHVYNCFILVLVHQ